MGRRNRLRNHVMERKDDRVRRPAQSDQMAVTVPKPTRTATLLESTGDIWAPGRCSIRRVGQDEATSPAFASCNVPAVAQKSLAVLFARIESDLS